MALVPYTPLTVADALAEPPLAKARVLAGSRGLSRVVRSVGVLDIDDLAGVTTEQFVLSSAYPLMSIDRGALVERLADRAASALGVKSHGYWTEMPPELAAAAEVLELPLVELPPGPFDDLVNPLLAAIAGRQAEGLRRAAELHEALTRTALAEVDLGAVVATVARALGRPTAIVDEHGDVLAAAAIDGVQPPAVLAAQAAARDRVGRGEGEGSDWLLAPISALGRFYGALCVYGTAAEEAFMRSALTEAATVSGMLIVGQRRVEAVHRRFERELLDDLVDRRLVDPADTVDRARRIGWPSRRPYVVLVAGRRRQGGGPFAPIVDAGFAEETIAGFSHALRGLPFQMRLYIRNPGLCVIVHLDDEAQAAAATEAVAGRLVGGGGGAGGRAPLVIGVARPRASLRRLPDAFREAAITVLTSPRIRTGEASVEAFAKLGPTRLAASVRDRHSLEELARDGLGALADPSLPGAPELLDTLAVLLDHNMSVADTAAELFFHYNTVRHRLGRLREILGERLTTPEGRTSLALAVGALRVLRAEADSLLSKGRVPAGIDALGS